MNIKTTSEFKIKTTLFDENKRFYAFANEEHKTWFITKNKNFSFGKTFLLYVITGKKTNKPISTKTTYPTKNDIVDTVDSGRIEIVEIEDFLH